jgi:TolA-binding protein
MGSGRPTNPPHQQGSGVGSNNLFADGDRGVWAYVQSLEDKVKQMADQLTTLENEKKSHREQVIQQQDQINRLSQEVFSLRGQQSSQSQALQAPVSGHS